MLSGYWLALFVVSEGAGVPGSMRAESRMVIETVTKSTTTTSSTMVTQQQQQQTFTQQQQLHQLVQPVTPALAVDASKVTASGSGLHQSNVDQETSFIVDGSQSG